MSENHHHGLQHDLKVIGQRMVERRRLLAWFGTGGAAALLAGCGGDDSSATAATTTTTTTTTVTPTPTPTPTVTPTPTPTTAGAACIADPQETNGPYPSDGSNSVGGTISNILANSGIVRADIRSSFGSSTTAAQGVPVTLTITLVNTNSSCAPLAGYAIYLWHCDRDGRYSLYDLPAENYLRGVQTTNSSGQATFTTIFPGAYAGRYPHIHFEVYPSLASATTYRNAILTSQFAMPRDISSTVYASATGYSASASRLAASFVATDMVFGDNTDAQIAAMTPTMAGRISLGFNATATVGVAR